MVTCTWRWSIQGLVMLALYSWECIHLNLQLSTCVQLYIQHIYSLEAWLCCVGGKNINEEWKIAYKIFRNCWKKKYFTYKENKFCRKIEVRQWRIQGFKNWGGGCFEVWRLIWCPSYIPYAFVVRAENKICMLITIKFICVLCSQNFQK